MLFEKFGLNSPGHLPPRAGGKKLLFWDRLWTLTEHISAMEHVINNWKETHQSTGTLLNYTKTLTTLKLINLHAPKIRWTLVQKRIRMVGEFLPTPYIFALGDTASLTVWTLYNRQQTNFGTCYVVARAYSPEQHNAGRAHSGLCHASSVCYKQTASYQWSVTTWPVS